MTSLMGQPTLSADFAAGAHLPVRLPYVAPVPSSRCVACWHLAELEAVVVGTTVVEAYLRIIASPDAPCQATP